MPDKKEARKDGDAVAVEKGITEPAAAGIAIPGSWVAIAGEEVGKGHSGSQEKKFDGKGNARGVAVCECTMATASES